MLPIAEEGAVVEQVLAPDDPKKRKNEELKRKALLIARKEESRKGHGSASKMSSSNGLSRLDAETLSNGGISDMHSEVQSSTSSDV